MILGFRWKRADRSFEFQIAESKKFDSQNVLLSKRLKLHVGTNFDPLEHQFLGSINLIQNAIFEIHVTRNSREKCL